MGDGTDKNYYNSKKLIPTIDNIPINELPITYGRLGGSSLEVKIAALRYFEQFLEEPIEDKNK